MKLLPFIYFLSALLCFGGTFETDFPANENPMSQGGIWKQGKVDGLFWSNVRTTNGYACGTETGLSGTTDDSTALLNTGTWNSNQTVWATVKIVQATNSGFQEIELRLRTTISNNWCRGYEVLFNADTAQSYCQIVRWDGMTNSYTELNSGSGLVHDGDIISATISNNLITAYINGVQACIATDTATTNVSVGNSVGFGFYEQTDTHPEHYGISRWGATDGTTNSYYVDFGSGADANDGLSTATAFQHSPGDPNAASSAILPLQSGTSVYFKGGVSYSLVRTGIVASVGVTYSTNGSWGTGQAILTGNNYSNIVAIGHSVGLTNVTVNGLCFTNIGGTNSLPSDAGGTNYAPNGLLQCPGYGVLTAYATNLLVENCTFTKLGYWQNFKPVGNASLNGDAVIITGGCSGVTITNCDISLMRDPIQIFGGGKPMANVTICSNKFHENMEWAINVLATSTNDYRTNMDIYGNVFTNTDQFYNSAGLWTGYGEGPHENAIFMYGSEACGGNYGLDRPVGDTNVFIHHNGFINTSNNTGGSTVIWLEDSTSGYIYDNLIVNTHQANGAIQITEPSTNTPFAVWVFNNTVWSTNRMFTVGGALGCTSTQWWWAPVASGRLVTVWNNIFSSQNTGNNNAVDYFVYYSTNGPGLVGLDLPQFTNNVLLDYNSYFSDQGWTQAHPTNFLLGSYVPTGFALAINQDPATAITYDTKVTYGWDTHSKTNLAMFVGAIWIHAETNDFRLQPTSPLVGAGTNLTTLLSALPMITKDFAGNTRAATGNWDLGAIGTNGIIVGGSGPNLGSGTAGSGHATTFIIAR